MRQSNTRVVNLSLHIFVALISHFRDYLRSEIEVFMSTIFLRILEEESSNEEKKSSQTVIEEEASRNGEKQSASRRKARQGWVVFKDIREVWSSRAERCLRRSLLKSQVEWLRRG